MATAADAPGAVQSPRRFLYERYDLTARDITKATLLLDVRDENWPQAVKVIVESTAESLDEAIGELDRQEFASLFSGVLRSTDKHSDAAFKTLLGKADRVSQIPDPDLDGIFATEAMTELLSAPSLVSASEAQVDDPEHNADEDGKDAAGPSPASTSPAVRVLARMIGFLQTDKAQHISRPVLEGVRDAWVSPDVAPLLDSAVQHGIATEIITRGDAIDDAIEVAYSQFALDLVGHLIESKGASLEVALSLDAPGRARASSSLADAAPAADALPPSQRGPLALARAVDPATLLFYVRKDKWLQAVKVIAEASEASRDEAISALNDQEFASLFLGVLNSTAEHSDAAFGTLFHKDVQIGEMSEADVDKIFTNDQILSILRGDAEAPGVGVEDHGQDGDGDSKSPDAAPATHLEIVLSRMMAFLQSEHASQISLLVLETLEAVILKSEDKWLEGAWKRGIEAGILAKPEREEESAAAADSGSAGLVSSEDAGMAGVEREESAVLESQVILDRIAQLIRDKTGAQEAALRAQQKHWRWSDGDQCVVL